MKLKEAKQQFIQHWGVFGSQWGINKTMAQLHALLLVSEKPLSTDNIMEELSISRGNANTNIRELMDWELVQKITIAGDRKEYFTAEKDIWQVATKVLYRRKKKELDPIVKVLSQLTDIEGDGRSVEIKAFKDTVQDIEKLAKQLQRTVDIVIKAKENWFWGKFVRLFK